METVTLVRNELGPLLDRLITQLEHEGKLTHQAHFSRIRSRLNCANDDWELASPIIDLSTANAMGFQFSRTADVLVARLLSKSQRLIRQLNGIDQPRH
ncbi:MAG: hypothetical protein GWP50_03910 [Proteobacteria bacterium]|nr:hypothetical protein [Pseudomonadota bacterium]